MLKYIVTFELKQQSIKTFVLPYNVKQSLYEKIHAENLQDLGDLIGNPIGYAQAFDIQRGKLLPTKRSKFKIISNYRSAEEFVRTYTTKSFFAPSAQLLTHINNIAMSRIVDDWELARFRTFSEKPNEIYDTWYSNRDFYPNIKNDQYFEEIFRWIGNPNSQVHKLIQVAVLLFEIIDKAPLYSGNQITAILAIATLLKEYGYNNENIIPMAKVINYISEDLEAAFKLSKSSHDLTIFIEAFLYTSSLEMMNLEVQHRNVFESKVKKNSEYKDVLNDRQLKLIEYLEIQKKISRREYTRQMGISFMTSYRDLQEMVDKGYLKTKGSGRGTFYVLPEELQSKEVSSDKPEYEVFTDL